LVLVVVIFLLSKNVIHVRSQPASQIMSLESQAYTCYHSRYLLNTIPNMWDFVWIQRNRYLRCVDNVCNGFVWPNLARWSQKIYKSVTRAGFTFLVLYLCARRKLYITVTKFELRTLYKWQIYLFTNQRSRTHVVPWYTVLQAFTKRCWSCLLNVCMKSDHQSFLQHCEVMQIFCVQI
jgi:hypothetical protein